MNGQEIRNAAPATGKRHYGRLRRGLLGAAFLLIAINPVLNYYWGLTFVQGWYQSLGIGELRLVSPLEGLESILVTRQISLPLLFAMAIPLLMAALLGRVFCSWVCPISFLAELMEQIRRRISSRTVLRDRLVLARQWLWFALIGELLLSLILGSPLFVFLSPPGLVGRELMMAVYFHSLAWEGILLIAVLLLELVTRRFYCRSFCPLGGLLALVGMKRRLVIVRSEERCIQCGRCDRSCPLGLTPSIGESLSSYCWNCGTCIDRCEHTSLEFIWRTGSQDQVSRSTRP